jgi:hypothetical protein
VYFAYVFFVGRREGFGTSESDRDHAMIKMGSIKEKGCSNVNICLEIAAQVANSFGNSKGPWEHCEEGGRSLTRPDRVVSNGKSNCPPKGIPVKHATFLKDDGQVAQCEKQFSTDTNNYDCTFDERLEHYKKYNAFSRNQDLAREKLFYDVFYPGDNFNKLKLVAPDIARKIKKPT